MEQQINNGIVLLDEQGNEIEFELLDVVPYENKDYAVLFPVDDAVEEAVILELLPSPDDTAEEELKGVEDPRILDAVFQLFLSRQEES